MRKKLVDKELIGRMAERLSVLPHYSEVIGKISPVEFVRTIAPVIV